MSEEIIIEDLMCITKNIYQDLTLQLEKNLKYENANGIQVYLLVYILRHHPEGTYITELCHKTGLSKPSMSELIKNFCWKRMKYYGEQRKWRQK